MNTQDTPNYFEKMSYMQDFGCMCGDEKFLNKEEIRDRCHCSDLVKKSCLALVDMLKGDYPNKENIIKKFIEITKDNIRESFILNQKSHDRQQSRES